MLIAFEGLDGSGKDTIIKEFDNFLTENNIKHIVLHPLRDNGKVGRAVLDSISLSNFVNPMDYRSKEAINLFLYAAMVMNIKIKEYLNQGYLVILNRWIYSTYAYNATDDFLRKHMISLIDENMLLPEHIVYLDISPEKAFERIRNRDYTLNETNNHLTEDMMALLDASRGYNLLFGSQLDVDFIHKTKPYSLLHLPATNRLESNVSRLIAAYFDWSKQHDNTK